MESTQNLLGHLEGLPRGSVVAFDTEWVDYDKDRSNVNNGLVACATFAWFTEDGHIQPAYVHNLDESEGLIDELRDLLSDPERVWTAHYVQVDWHAFMNHGIDIRGPMHCTLVMDFFCDERRENRHGLKECVEDFFGIVRKDFRHTFGSPKLKKDGTPYASGELIVPSLRDVAMTPEGRAKLVEYATQDAIDGLALHHMYRRLLEGQPWRGDDSMYVYFQKVEVPTSRLICEAEREGMPLDLPYLRLMREQAEKDIAEVTRAISDTLGCPINPSSDKQMRHVVYGVGGLDITKGTGKNLRTLYTIPGFGFPVYKLTDTGQPALNKDAVSDLLWRYDHEWTEDERDLHTEDQIAALKEYVRYSAIETQLSTFLVGLEEKALDGRVHTRLIHAGPTSGRFASRGPNLQNISAGDKDIYNLRDAFHAPEGFSFLVIDFNQLEYRLLAHVTQDPVLVNAFCNGMDLHGITHYGSFPDVKEATIRHFGKELSVEDLPLDEVLKMLKWIKETFADTRKYAKIINFETIYGVGPRKLAEQLRISVDQARDRLDGWHRMYPGVRRWQKRELEKARKLGFIRTLAGRYRRPVMWKLMHDDQGVRGGEERSILNAKIQGSARDIAVRAMLVLSNDRAFQSCEPRFVNQVHDELIYLVPTNKARKALDYSTDCLNNRLLPKPLLVPMPVSAGVGPSWGSAKVLERTT